MSKTTQFLKSFDKNKMAEELLQWLIDGVEEYIDNSETVFSVYFPVNSEVIKNMPITNEFGNMYIKSRESKAKNCEEVMKGFTDALEEVKSLMSNNEEMLGQLFKRMIWYYEMVGFHKLKGPIIQEMEGYVVVNKLDFELIGIDICITKKMNRVDKNGELVASDKELEIVKQEHIPEGFSLEIEIKKWAKVNSASLL